MQIRSLNNDNRRSVPAIQQRQLLWMLLRLLGFLPWIDDLNPKPYTLKPQNLAMLRLQLLSVNASLIFDQQEKMFQKSKFKCHYCCCCNF
jgi:hypothetical protein